MPLQALRAKIKNKNLSPAFGLVAKISSTYIVGRGLAVGIGDIVEVARGAGAGAKTYAMVTQVDLDEFFISPFSFIEGIKIGDLILSLDKGLQIGVAPSLLGRVVDPLMNPLDGKPPITPTDFIPIMRQPIKPMQRALIKDILTTGIKTIDGLITTGLGQKMGIFAGSGVGKSTLMGMIVRGVSVPIKVVALIGERGREIPEFIQNNLGGDLTNTVIVAATSDDSPLLRKYGAFSAMAVAEFFKAQGHDVLFMMDSVTRFAMAQREIGLSLGEPPTTKGYPPSVFAVMPQLMERAGKEIGLGTITAFFTVLVEGDDMSDPVADQARSILDGHIVLSRALTDYGIYPPIDVLSSVSRLFNDLCDERQKNLAQNFRRLYSLLKENEVLIRIGAYNQGSDRELDEAIKRKGAFNGFLKQKQHERFDLAQIKDLLTNIFV